MTSPTETSPTPSDKTVPHHHDIAATMNNVEQGLVATDQCGTPPVDINEKAESRLRRKINFYVLPPVALMYLFCFIDRANIGNAKLAGLEHDLNLHGNDYNAILSIFYIAYIIFEIPSTIACKLIGPGWFLPTITVLFGICSLCTSFVHSIHTASAVRFLLGIFEAGMMPGIAYYLSRWYRQRELAFYLSIYVVTAPLAGAFGGLLASAILTLDHLGTLHSWRMIFAIEGLLTITLGLLTFFILTDRPKTARWLSPEQKHLAITRLMSERVNTTELLDKLDKPKILRGILSPITLTTSLIFLLNNITVSGLAFFAPTIVKSIYPNTTIVAQQLHTVPPYLVGAFFTILFPYLSFRFNHRLIFFLLAPPLMITGYIMFLTTNSPHIRYGATFFISSATFTFGALCNAHVSNNVVSDTARSAAIGVNVMFGNIGGLISTWSFLPSDAPMYRVGNGLNLTTSVLTFLLAAGMWVWMERDNRRRDQVDVERALGGLNMSEVQDLDWRNPGFRWRC